MSRLLPDRLYRDPRLARVAFVVLAALLLVVPSLVEAGMGRTWVRILDFAMLYVVLALGLNIVVGYSRPRTNDHRDSTTVGRFAAGTMG